MPKASRSSITAEPATTPGLPPTSRRRLLAGSGLTAIAAVFALPAAVPMVHAEPIASAVSPDQGDAELLAACRTFEAVEAALYAIPDSVADEIHAAALDDYHAAYDVVSPLQPQTMAGLKAKARVAMSGLQMQEPISVGDTVEDSAEWQVLGAWNLLKDVLAMGGAA